jgi:hypothetical protein
MVSAPFPRSHENGLPRNYHLREATKMTMLWISAKWCSKKDRRHRKKSRQRIFLFLFSFFYFFSFFSFFFYS